ncbi:MAG: hypothetical protein CMH25_03315 [Micavibrio sp.]|nr:hypothetical protein [Micavibrio sp.]|tara:strand:+ start:649711 stop:650244 length:534 start_codon:yes stop_codon:yes gene_type:complete
MKSYLQKLLERFFKEEDATALVEAALLTPVMLTLLMGSFDLGQGIMMNQKAITASQIAADLVSRAKTVNQSDVDNIVNGSKLAFHPHSTSSFGIDVVSLEYDKDSLPFELWRDTRNMTPNQTAVDSTAGLPAEKDGMIIVTVQYTYTPFFSGMLTDDINIQEVAFTRGRRSRTVTWE